MEVKTGELIGDALDWAVTKCEYDELAAKNIEYPQYAKFYSKISPSTIWSQGGPIIEREKITLEWTGEDWIGYIWHDDEYFAPTPLIAAMRCYVASKFGDRVEVPDDLMK
jgi:hypothetical protein